MSSLNLFLGLNEGPSKDIAAPSTQTRLKSVIAWLDERRLSALDAADASYLFDAANFCRVYLVAEARAAHFESAMVINRHDLTILHELAKAAHAAMEDSCGDDFSFEQIDYERLSEALDVFDQRWPDAMITPTSEIVDAMLPVGEAQR